jgi:predicted component of type VI protein secretion system
MGEGESNFFAVAVVFKFRNMKTGQAMPVPEGEFTVGRASDAYIRVEDPSVSRQHARVINNAEGVFIEDLGSGNGTALQGAYLSGRAKMKVGDLVHIGSVPFRIDPETGGEPAPALVAGLKPMDGASLQKATNRIPIGTPMASGPLPDVPVAPPAGKEKETASLIRKSVPLPTLVKLTAPPGTAESNATTQVAASAPIVTPEPQGEGSFTPDAVSWQWWLIVFLAGLGAGLFIGLYFAKVFLDMGGRPGSLP